MNETLCCIPCAKNRGLKLVGGNMVPYTTSMCPYCKQTAVLHMVDELVELRLIMLELKLIPDTSTAWLLKMRKENALSNHQRGLFLLHKTLRGRI